ncbi:NUDIX domain-containing protein [Dactylosporangium sp. NPDC005555]|uniref:NUDIX domain-containing protein n=1 Tax=Dactylosporangium sp. NPDC005555 TaxID=3154889 RepID=UPI0033B41517
MTRLYASAGAVVATAVTDPRLLLLDQIRVNGERQTVAPKGRLEPGEAPLAAALREVTEEAGLTGLRYAGYLGREQYQFTDRDSTPAIKTVDWFLLTADNTTTTAHTGEGFTEARWHTPADAAAAASHPGFIPFLERAAAIAAWRSDGPLPFSITLDRAVRDIAAAAQPLLDSHPGAGLAVCGSAARGDFIEGWSDIDLIAYGLPHSPDLTATLTALVGETATRLAAPISLHVADSVGRRIPAAGPLYDIKLHTALRRIGIDVAVIAGAAPATQPSPAAHETLAALAALHAFAADRGAQPATDTPGRRDRARRILSVTCSAARIVALTTDEKADLRLPALVDVLDRHQPGAAIQPLLRDYDTFRRAGAPDLDTAEHLADHAADAIDDLIRRLHAPKAAL